MDYRKPSKVNANEAYLRSLGIEKGRAYAEETKLINKTFLIICEGENTEPGYFRAFPVPTNRVLVEGGCNSKTALVDYALKLKVKAEYQGREVWCVFDYDVQPDQPRLVNDFNSAIDKAERNGLKVAWSNDAFELWFILHYQHLDTKLTRHELYDILKPVWQLDPFQAESKTDWFCSEHYKRHQLTGASQKLAIRRAKNLHKSYTGARNFADQCPCTTVYLLVEELNKYLKK